MPAFVIARPLAEGAARDVVIDCVFIDRWRGEGKKVALARVVGVEGSGPRLPGAAMVVSEAGEVAGSVSGGCVEGAVVTEALAVLAGEGRPHITLCGRNSVQIHERHRPVDFVEVRARLEPHGLVRHNDFVLKFWPKPFEMTLFPDGRAIIKGTTDTAVARSLYARYVGS